MSSFKSVFLCCTTIGLENFRTDINEPTGADIFDRHLSVLEQKQPAPAARYFLEKIYLFKKQSAAPDPVKNLLFTANDHTGKEKYRIRVLLVWNGYPVGSYLGCRFFSIPRYIWHIWDG